MTAGGSWVSAGPGYESACEPQLALAVLWYESGYDPQLALTVPAGSGYESGCDPQLALFLQDRGMNQEETHN